MVLIQVTFQYFSFIHRPDSTQLFPHSKPVRRSSLYFLSQSNTVHPGYDQAFAAQTMLGVIDMFSLKHLREFRSSSFYCTFAVTGQT